MKRSTKYSILGFILFFIGSVIVQMYIDPILYIGVIAMYIAWMLIEAKISEEEHERHIEEFNSLNEKINETLEDMRNLNESDSEEDEINENDFIKKSEQ